MQGVPSFAEVVVGGARCAVVRRRPVEAVSVAARVLALLIATASEHGIEPRAAAREQRRVGGLASVLGVRADTAVALRQLPPLGVRRQAPTIAELSAGALRRLPRVEAAVLSAARGL